MTPELVVHPDPDATAADAAERLVSALAAAQATRGTASVVLTGGGIGIAMLRAVAGLVGSPGQRRDEIDWAAIEVFWGDERFVAAGSADRNDAQAREALLDQLALDPSRVHPMASGGSGEPEAGAEEYARVLSEAAARLGHDGGMPTFDVLLAGCGPEGHTLSVFPDSPAAHVSDVGVVTVRDCPKPPPTRISLTLPAARCAREVWLAATGEGKAEVLARALHGADVVDVPLAGLAGTERTLWLLDEAAAAAMPR